MMVKIKIMVFWNVTLHIWLIGTSVSQEPTAFMVRVEEWAECRKVVYYMGKDGSLLLVN
jgi:hypothetical protein